MVGASQYTSVDVTALTAPAAAAAPSTGVDKRRQVFVMATEADAAAQSICLDELAPVMEHSIDH